MTTSFTQMFEISRSGLMLRMIDLDSVSHNLANVNTTGYKKVRTNFQELLNQVVAGTNTAENSGLAIDIGGMNGIQLNSSQIILRQGDIKNTGRELDIAIQGEGFFGVYLSDGTIAYSRDGCFQVDSDSQLVNSSGRQVVWNGTIPENTSEVKIDDRGNVYATVDGVDQAVGNIGLFRFSNPTGVQSLGDNLFQATEASGEAVAGEPSSEGFGSLVSQSLENSNVNLSEEITRMITLQRGFEMSIKALQQSDQMLAQAIQLRQG